LLQFIRSEYSLENLEINISTRELNDSLEMVYYSTFELRNTIRNNTRDLMKDEKKKAELPAQKGSFDDLVKKKREKYPAWSREEILKDIIRSSQTSNEKYDRRAGIRNDRKD